MKIVYKFASLLVVVLCFQTAWAQETEAEIELYKAMVDQDRNIKNSEFKNPEGSPIRISDMATFEGLFYYDVDIKYKVKAQFSMLEEQVPVTMKTTDDKTVDLIKYGKLSFELDGKNFTLSVFRNQNLPELAKSPGHLIIPFTDETNGEATNTYGRYLTLPNGQEAGEVELDFNRAFNPYQVYNDDYSSIIPPEENGLNLLIRAGERKYEDR
jgi:uncharacterized protein (DUF1684 family)